MSDAASEDAIFTCDADTPTISAALPIAIGAQAASLAGRFSLSGDGGSAIMMGDFIKLVQQGLTMKVVIFDNSWLSFVEAEMKTSAFLNYWVA